MSSGYQSLLSRLPQRRLPPLNRLVSRRVPHPSRLGSTYLTRRVVFPPLSYTGLDWGCVLPDCDPASSVLLSACRGDPLGRHELGDQLLARNPGLVGEERE